jgi:hypothetical protein
MFEEITVTEAQIREVLRNWCIIDLVANEIVEELKAKQGEDHVVTH